MSEEIRETIALNDHHIRAYSSEKLRAHTAKELVYVSKRLFDRSRLEIALTNKLEELVKELEKIAAKEKEKLDESIKLERSTAAPRKSKTASMVSGLFGR
jgi:hypothetical protein